MSIQHLYVNKDPIIKDQWLHNLGKINALTGKNSSGKTTILKAILKKPIGGADFFINKDLFDRIKASFTRNSAEAYFLNWLDLVQERLVGKIISANNIQEITEVLTTSQNDSSLRRYNIIDQLNRVTMQLIEFYSPEVKPILLSPKRRLSHYADAQANESLDEEAQNALSRLFFLKNQPLYESSHNLYEKIFDSFLEITGYKFDIELKIKSTTIQLRFKKGSGGWILAQDEGQGLSEILTMVLYALDGEFNLILIEEPENHLHPDFQKRMLSFLNTVEDRQFILSTHSTIFLNTSLTNKIYLARFKDDKIYIDDKTSRVEIFSEIGFWGTDNIVSDAIIITEGKNDHILMDYIFKHWYNIANTFSVSYVFLSGSMMAFFDPTPFAQLRNVFVLLDKDTKDKKPRDKFIKRCKSQNIFPTVLKRYSIENYYSFKGIKVVFKDLIKHQIIEIHKDIPLWEQLADADHSKQWWEGEVKSPQKMLPILKNMELKDIEGTDLDEFCKKIKKFSTE
jgi:Uncharacterized conserved protein